VRLDSLPVEGGRMNFPGRPTPEEQEKSLRPELRGVGYRRELEDGGLTWIQYWLWYLYNPKVPTSQRRQAELGQGREEGRAPADLRRPRFARQLLQGDR
jgi:hypothetical protein